MFVKVQKHNNGKVTILIVENVRTGSKVHQKKLCTVATVFSEEVSRSREVAEHIKVEMEVERLPKLFSVQTLSDMVISSRNRSLTDDSPLAVNLRILREESRIVTGIHDIYGSLYDETGFGGVLKFCSVSRSVIKDVLAKPCSKRSTCELCWQHTRSLFTEEIRVMFYDCTTLYFESFTEDELRRFGYSKDHKFNQGQILLALMVSKEGLPVGYDVFAGNMYEGDTFKTAIDRIKVRYGMKRVVIVADNIRLTDRERTGIAR